jgi:hypothetical protein
VIAQCFKNFHGKLDVTEHTEHADVFTLDAEGLTRCTSDKKLIQDFYLGLAILRNPNYLFSTRIAG